MSMFYVSFVHAPAFATVITPCVPFGGGWWWFVVAGVLGGVLWFGPRWVGEVMQG